MTQAADFARHMARVWEFYDDDKNAARVAARRGGVIAARVRSLDHWIYQPGDQPGFLMQWADGSRYIVGENGSWIHPPAGFLVSAADLAPDTPAISLHQPFASFIAAGLKPFETRHWPAPARLIGRRIAIHATKKRPSQHEIAWAGRCGIDALPLGAVLCTATLAGAYRCGDLSAVRGSPPAPAVAADEFGNYAAGRWAWWLVDIERIDPPIVMHGAQGVWTPRQAEKLYRARWGDRK
jgi:hypothetical protein